MMDKLPVLWFLFFFIQGSFSNVAERIDNGDEKATEKKISFSDWSCNEGDISCSNNNKLLCENGKWKEVSLCSNGKICIDEIGCTEFHSASYTYVPYNHSYMGEDVDATCKDGEYYCEENILNLCSDGTITKIDCSKQNKICYSGLCIDDECTEDEDGELKCAAGLLLQYCQSSKWYVIADCSINGQICENKECVVKQPSSCIPSEPLSCDKSHIIACKDGNWEKVIDCSVMGLNCLNGACAQCPSGNTVSTASSIRIPNLEDPTCESYYQCSTVESDCVPKKCDSGLKFDSCSGFCTPNTQCNLPESCSCSSTGVRHVLEVNKKLAYTCPVSGQSVSTVWDVCPNGEFNEAGACTSSTSTCYNGPQDDGRCTSAGRKPLADTNCKFRECKTDLTYTDIRCMDNYHYDDSRKGCIAGQCMNMTLY